MAGTVMEVVAGPRCSCRSLMGLQRDAAPLPPPCRGCSSCPIPPPFAEETGSRPLAACEPFCASMSRWIVCDEVRQSQRCFRGSSSYVSVSCSTSTGRRRPRPRRCSRFAAGSHFAPRRARGRAPAAERGRSGPASRPDNRLLDVHSEFASHVWGERRTVRVGTSTEQSRLSVPVFMIIAPCWMDTWRATWKKRTAARYIS